MRWWEPMIQNLSRLRLGNTGRGGDSRRCIEEGAKQSTGSQWREKKQAGVHREGGNLRWLATERERERQGEKHIRGARKPCELQGPNLAWDVVPVVPIFLSSSWWERCSGTQCQVMQSYLDGPPVNWHVPTATNRIEHPKKRWYFLEHPGGLGKCRIGYGLITKAPAWPEVHWKNWLLIHLWFGGPGREETVARFQIGSWSWRIQGWTPTDCISPLPWVICWGPGSRYALQFGRSWILHL